QDDVRHARLRRRGRQGDRVLPGGGQVGHALRVPGVRGEGEARRGRHVAHRLRDQAADAGGGGEDHPARAPSRGLSRPTESRAGRRPQRPDRTPRRAVEAGATGPRAGAPYRGAPAALCWLAPSRRDVRRRRPAPVRPPHGGQMSIAAKTGTPKAPERHPADSHDLIRVQGARENNLKDVSVEIPKRRLTVFTGVSGSGKSSLVFDTIAAESQRMINETYSAFVQGFMPALARPDVDVLEGLTTAIIVDQERMGANARSTVGTATDANALLRILFSRLGQPH